jgi:hypothetical protein
MTSNGLLVGLARPDTEITVALFSSEHTEPQTEKTIPEIT